MDAAIVYNDGELGRASIFEKLGLNFGQYCKRGFLSLDERRIKGSKNTEKDKVTADRQEKRIQVEEQAMADDS